MASPRLEPLVLTEEERQVLEGWARRRKTAQALALRSRIVLACADEGGVAPLTAVAARTGVSREGPQVAGPVHGAPDGRPGRCAAAGGAADDH